MECGTCHRTQDHAYGNVGCPDCGRTMAPTMAARRDHEADSGWPVWMLDFGRVGNDESGNPLLRGWMTKEGSDWFAAVYLDSTCILELNYFRGDRKSLVIRIREAVDAPYGDWAAWQADLDKVHGPKPSATEVAISEALERMCKMEGFDPNRQVEVTFSRCDHPNWMQARYVESVMPCDICGRVGATIEHEMENA